MRKRNPSGKRKTICSKCGSQLRTNQRYCKDCHAEWMRNNRPKHNELSNNQRLKANTRAYLNVYVKRGKIVKSPCAKCGELKVEAHHEDYAKPLEVIWLCRACHLQIK